MKREEILAALLRPGVSRESFAKVCEWDEITLSSESVRELGERVFSLALEFQVKFIALSSSHESEEMLQNLGAEILAQVREEMARHPSAMVATLDQRLTLETWQPLCGRLYDYFAQVGSIFRTNGIPFEGTIEHLDASELPSEATRRELRDRILILEVRRGVLLKKEKEVEEEDGDEDFLLKLDLEHSVRLLLQFVTVAEEFQSLSFPFEVSKVRQLLETFIEKVKADSELLPLSRAIQRETANLFPEESGLVQ